MLQESERSANDAMNKFFNEREDKGRMARQHARLREQQKRRREGNDKKGQDGDSEEDEGPMVSTTSRTSQLTPSNASANMSRKGKDQKETVNQQSTVTIEDDDDSDDVVAVATTRTG